MRIESALLIALTVAGTAGQDGSLPFEYLFTLGSERGVNPNQPFSGKLGRTIFGATKMSALNLPTALTVDREQRVWVADRGNSSVHMFDLLANRYKALRGAEEIPFVEPAGIDSDQHGQIYVTDAALGRIFLFDRDGVFVRMLPGRKTVSPLKRPTSIAISADLKSIFVADEGNHTVLVMNQEGETVRSLGKPGSLQSPAAVTLDTENDRVYVLDRATGKVSAFSPGGRLLERVEWPGVRSVSALAFDAENGNFYVGDNRHQVIRVFDAQRREIGAFANPGTGEGAFQSMEGLHVDSEERVYLIDRQSGKVLLFRPAYRKVPESLR